MFAQRPPVEIHPAANCFSIVENGFAPHAAVLRVLVTVEHGQSPERHAKTIQLSDDPIR
jgi:hypothetical protein